MDNRFGFKDLILCVLLIAIVISIWLAMKQFDRQYELIKSLSANLDQQTSAQARMERTLGQLQSRLDSGVAVPIGPATGSGSNGDDMGKNDPFARIRAAREAADYAEGDWVVDAFPAQVARVTPLISTDFYGSRIQARVLETLLTRDPDTLEWKPLLAEAWAVDDNSDTWRAHVDAQIAEGVALEDILDDPATPPAAVVTFDLRQGVTFSDGEPMTSDDVVFSYQLAVDEKIDAPRIRSLLRGKVRDVIAEGPYRVRFEFKEPYYNILALSGGLEVLPEHFYGAFSPEEINTKPGLLLGSGPYRMETSDGWAPGKPLELYRNERYWGVPPAFNRLVYREINNEVARLTAFTNGEIDMFYRALPDQYLQLTNNPDLMAHSEAFEVDRPIEGYGFIAWNQRKGDTPTPFADPRVRQAMTMLIDRQRMIDEILHGLGHVATGPFNRLSKQYDPEIEPWPYDVQRAKALLAEAGWIDRDGDGVLENEQGQPLVFKYTFPTQQGGQGFWDRYALSLVDGFAEAGVVMELDPLEWSVFAEKIKSRDFDALSMAWSAGIESDIYQMFHSDNIGDGADNFMSYSNPKLDELIDRARQTLDEDERMALWRQAHAILNRDLPYTFLYSRKFLMVLDDRFENVQKIMIGINDRDEWYTPLPLQKY